MPAWLSWLVGIGREPMSRAEWRRNRLRFVVTGLRIYATDEAGNAELVAYSPESAEWFRVWIEKQSIEDRRK